MKKIFYISNRNSGKTNLAVFEFLKDPEKSLMINFKSESFEKINDSNLIPKDFLKNFIFRLPIKIENNIKRIIFDDYLQMTTELREYFYINLKKFQIEEIYCFSTPKILYSNKTYNFVNEVKKNSAYSDNLDFLSKNELLVEINDPTAKTKSALKNELSDLYFNYLTDPETIIINNKFFYNQKIFKLENISYFPDNFRENTELRAEFLFK